MYQPEVSMEQIPLLDLIRGKDSSPPSTVVEFDARRPCLEIIKAKAKRGNSSQTTEECNAPVLPSRAPPLLAPFGSQHEHQLPVTSGDINRSKKKRTTFSNHQIKRLEEKFSQQKYITKIACCQLASCLGLTEKQVKHGTKTGALSGRRNALNQTGASSVRLQLSSGTSTVTGRSKHVLHLSNFSRTN